MGQLRYWHSAELSAGDRPTLRENEIDILVVDSVGLYQGKSKILQRQNGRMYLTSQRLIYIDNNEPKNMSLSLEISDFKSINYTSKFLKSSPKVSIFFKSTRRKQKNTNSTTARTTTWVCQICSFANEVSVNINYGNPQSLPVCQTCGVRAEADVIKTAIKSLSDKTEETQKSIKPGTKSIVCSACTFRNHPSMRNCEICGSILPVNAVNELTMDEQEIFDDRIRIATEVDDGLDDVKTPFIKISFHKGGDKTFYERLDQAMEKLKWDSLVKLGNVNINSKRADQDQIPETLKQTMGLGLHKLTQIEDNQTKKNEQIINSSLDDLQTLLAKAYEIQGLIESFKKLQTGDDRSQSRIIPTINQVTQDVLSDPSKERQKKLYLQEASRQISEFLIQDGTLEQEGGIITLIDLYALYNRGRVGLNLISPNELFEACTYFEFLKLPLILKKISKVLVVQDMKFKNTDQLIDELKNFIQIYGMEDDFSFKHTQILRVSEFFNWSLSIAEEILKLGLESGALCVDQQVTGKRYYLNEFFSLADKEMTNGELSVMQHFSENPSEIGLGEDLLSTSETQTSLNELKGLMDEFPEIPASSPFQYPIEKCNNPIQGRKSALADLEGLQF